MIVKGGTDRRIRSAGAGARGGVAGRAALHRFWRCSRSPRGTLPTRWCAARARRSPRIRRSPHGGGHENGPRSTPAAASARGRSPRAADRRRRRHDARDRRPRCRRRRHVSRAVRSELKGDVVFGNLEGTLTDVDSGKCSAAGEDCYAFRTPPAYARYLRRRLHGDERRQQPLLRLRAGGPGRHRARAARGRHRPDRPAGRDHRGPRGRAAGRLPRASPRTRPPPRCSTSRPRGR